MNDDREYEFICRQVDKEMSRRRLFDCLLKSGAGSTTAWWLAASGVAGMGFAGCGGSGDGGVGSSDRSAGSSDTLKVGVIAPFSGLGSFVGQIVQRALDASVRHVNSEGGIGGRKVEVGSKDVTMGNVQQSIDAYLDLSGKPDVIGVIWGTIYGIDDIADRLANDMMPITVPFSDETRTSIWPTDRRMRSMFQFAVPEDYSVPAIARYFVEDRGLQRVALGTSQAW